MKKLILLLSLGLSIISCSSEENEVPENETPSLLKFEQRKFQNGTLTNKIITNYNDQKPILTSFYNQSNTLTFTREYEYSSEGLLVSIKGYMQNGTLNSETTISYDNLNRIIKTIRLEENNTYNTTSNFIYNNNNSITSNSNSNGNLFSKTFEINSNGIIHKEIQNGILNTSVQYDNLKPIIRISNSTTYNYTYLETGSLPSSNQSILGGNKVNGVLFQNSLDTSSAYLTTELIKKISSNSSEEEYIYTLNNNGFPLTKKGYYNGELENEYDYTYE